MPLEKVSKLTVGELGGKNDEIRDAVSEIKLSFSSDGVSQLEFTVADPGFKMHNAGYFVIRRRVYYEGVKYEIAAVEVNGDPGETESVDVTCRLEAIQKMKRAKGQKSFGSISPTSFASSQASQYGLKFFGESSAAKEAITRVQNDNQDESTWDVLRRLANKIQFSVYESGGILYFASEKFILQKQPDFAVGWPPSVFDDFYIHSIRLRRSDDDPLGADITVEMDRTNGVKVRPGMAMQLVGIEYFTKKFLVTSVEWQEASPEPVRVSGRTLEDTPDTGCESKTFRRGSRGDCVKRIQQAVGAKADGIFGPKTEAAVKKFQAKYGLTANGVVDSKTWEAIKEHT